MSLLAQPTTINGLRLRNRIVMLPMVTNLSAKDGQATQALLNHYAERARRDISLVIVETTAIGAETRNTVNSLGIWGDFQIPSLARLVDSIKAGGAAAAIQLTHAGAKTYCDEQPPVSASPVRLRAGMAPRQLREDELPAIVDQFAQAARRAQAAGFDAVEIHAAHFYLLSAFLSPFSNRRDDGYGGDRERRARLAVEVTRAVRQTVGAAYPVLVRMHGGERLAGGMTEEDVLETARLLAGAGADAVDVSVTNQSAALEDEHGTYYSMKPYLTKEQPAGALAYQAVAIRHASGLPVIAVGKLGDPAAAEALLAAGDVDLIGVARGFLVDPSLATKMLAGRGDDIVRCKQCLTCLNTVVGKQLPIRCAVNKQVGQR